MKSAADKIKGRQLEILERMAQGEKREAIASDLGISMGTMNQYCSRLYLRLAVHTPAQALFKFLRLRNPELSLR